MHATPWILHVVLIMSPIRIPLRLSLKWWFSEIISRLCSALFALSCIGQRVQSVHQNPNICQIKRFLVTILNGFIVEYLDSCTVTFWIRCLYLNFNFSRSTAVATADVDVISFKVHETYDMYHELRRYNKGNLMHLTFRLMLLLLLHKK